MTNQSLPDVAELFESRFEQFDSALSVPLEVRNYRSGGFNDRGRPIGREFDAGTSGEIEGTVRRTTRPEHMVGETGQDVRGDVAVFIHRSHLDGTPIELNAVGDDTVEYATDIVDSTSPVDVRYRVLSYRYQHNSLVECHCREVHGRVEEPEIAPAPDPDDTDITTDGGV